MWGALIRSVPVAAPAVRGYATKASTDPVQKIFVDKLKKIAAAKPKDAVSTFI